MAPSTIRPAFSLWPKYDRLLRERVAAGWARSRGEIMQRGFAHDVSHIGEINDALGRAGLDQVDIWS